jgi:hypothetical protein
MASASTRWWPKSCIESFPHRHARSCCAKAASRALYIIAEELSCPRRLAATGAVAPHGRKLIADLRERTIEAEDSAPEITGRIRLALHWPILISNMAPVSAATGLYRATSAYLLRAMAMDPRNGSRQRDFARIQEQLGDLTARRVTSPPRWSITARAWASASSWPDRKTGDVNASRIRYACTSRSASDWKSWAISIAP